MIRDQHSGRPLDLVNSLMVRGGMLSIAFLASACSPGAARPNDPQPAADVVCEPPAFGELMTASDGDALRSLNWSEPRGVAVDCRHENSVFQELQSALSGACVNRRFEFARSWAHLQHREPLVAEVVAMAGEPESLRTLHGGETLAAGDLLSIQVEISEPAFVYLALLETPTAGAPPAASEMWPRAIREPYLARADGRETSPPEAEASPRFHLISAAHAPSQTSHYPGRGQSLRLDDSAGTSRLLVLISTTQLPLDRATAEEFFRTTAGSCWDTEVMHKNELGVSTACTPADCAVLRGIPLKDGVPTSIASNQQSVSLPNEPSGISRRVAAHAGDDKLMVSIKYYRTERFREQRKLK